MRRTVLVALILGLVLGTVSIVEANDDKWRIRGFYVKTWPSTDSYQTESVIGDLPLVYNELSLDSGQGFELDIGYMFNPKLELVLTGIFTDLEGTFVAGIELGEGSDRVTDNSLAVQHFLYFINRSLEERFDAFHFLVLYWRFNIRSYHAHFLTSQLD